MKKNAKQDVMMVADEIKTATGMEWPACIAKAHQLQQLIHRMENGTVSFAYERVDGTLRRATGTLKDVDHLCKGKSRNTYKTLCYYDIKAEAFRSFRVENLITIY